LSYSARFVVSGYVTVVENMKAMSVADATFQLAMLAEKAPAERNIRFIVPTDATFHPRMFWLNVGQLANISSMSLTDATFHLPISMLKALAPENS
jgi:hypothetical protein